MSTEACKSTILFRRSKSRILSDENCGGSINVDGKAYLCFPLDHAWFRGTISTEDENNYSLFGELVTADTPEKKSKVVGNLAEKVKILSLGEIQEESPASSQKDHEDNEDEKERKLSTRDYYRVVLYDHTSGVKHTLPKLYTKFITPARGQELQVFESKGRTVKFTVENKFKGEKAEIESHKLMGVPTPVGLKSVLYSGKISIRHNEGTDAVRSRAWSF